MTVTVVGVGFGAYIDCILATGCGRLLDTIGGIQFLRGPVITVFLCQRLNIDCDFSLEIDVFHVEKLRNQLLFDNPRRGVTQST